MSNYYYLAASLPPLEFPSFPDISSVELKDSLRLNLSKKDFKKVEVLRLFVDINNIRPLLLEEEIDLVPYLVFFAERMRGQHKSLLIDKPLFITEGNQTGSLPR